MTTEVIQAAISWLLNQRIDYGEAGIKILFHDGQIRRIEKTIVEKEQ